MCMNEQKQSKRWIGYLLLAVMAAAFLYRGVYQVATGKAQWDVQTAFLTMLILVIIGEVISTATKALCRLCSLPQSCLSSVSGLISQPTFCSRPVLLPTSLPSWL